jgi:hypothetical protein
MSNLKDFLGGLDPDVWTDTKAGYLDANVSSRAAASTALTNATWTDAKAGQIDANISSRAPSSTALSTSTWTNTKAGYIDGNISSRAAASTALSTAQWTNARAGKLDNLDAPISGVGGLSSNVWTNTKAGYLDTNISSRAPSSTALSSNVWTTTYRNRLDTNVSSRLGTCSVQHLNTRTHATSSNDYDTWSITSVNTNQAWLSLSSDLGGPEYSSTQSALHARFQNSTNVRYGVWRSYTNNHWGWTTPLWIQWNNQTYFSIHAIRIY